MEVDDSGERKIPVYAEAILLPGSDANPVDVRRRVEGLIKAGHAVFSDGPVDYAQDSFLVQNLQSLHIRDVFMSKIVSDEVLVVV